ncbi:MAG: Lar family restriction alleviation protein [Oscillospiraceae bacterium]
MSEIKLKPCPFCGGKVEIECLDDEYFYVTCSNCHSSTSFGFVYKDGTARDATKAETVKAWNKRTIEMIINQNGNNCTQIGSVGTLKL